MDKIDRMIKRSSHDVFTSTLYQGLGRHQPSAIASG